MGKSKFTEEQKKIIDAQNCNLLVAAAAGSGKTAVLVERIIKKVTRKEDPLHINEILVVTFTEAAAIEMKQRIAIALNKALENDPLNDHLRQQSVLINQSAISTIHSFCNRVVKQNFHAVSLDPFYRIADETESSILQESIMDEIFDAQYALEDNPLFFDLIEIYSDRFTDNKLRELILRIYHFSINSENPRDWLFTYTEMFQLEEDYQIDNTLWVQLIKEEIILQLEGALSAAEQALHICAGKNGPEKYVENINSDIDTIVLLLKSCKKSMSAMYDAFHEVKFSRLAIISAKDTTVDGHLKELVKDIRDKEIKFIINSIREKIFFKSPDLQAEDLRNLYPHMRKLMELVTIFSQKYKDQKREKNFLDFNDLEHYCLEILSTKEEIALSLKNKYKEIYIDEYQDSNIVQEIILSKIAKENSRFMVGDIKQSIYKFRRANPEIFIEKYKAFEYDGINMKVDLSKNFRSRKEVISTVNYFFRQLMSDYIGDVHYDKNEELHYGAPFPEIDHQDQVQDRDQEDYFTEIYLVDSTYQNENDLNETIEELSNVEIESKLIAKKIQELVNGDNAIMLYDKDNDRYRQAKYEDVVILLRSTKNVSALVDALNQAHIPAFAESSGDYFKNIEVLTLLSILKLIDNPQQDIPLIGLLHSPIYGIHASGLYTIRKASDQGDYYHAVKTYLKESREDNDWIRPILIQFLSDLEKWRHLSSYISIAKLISVVLADTNYYTAVGAMPGGKSRQANITAFYEYAYQYEKTNYHGLFHFIKYIEKMMDKESNAKDLSLDYQNDNAVRIMTIHKSKGLEFPIVFVSMLGSRFNRIDERQNIILHQKYGFGPRYTDLENRIKHDTLARMSLSYKTQSENFSEEMRILYVAFTRAKEKLILTGCIKDVPKRLTRWARIITGDELKISHGYLLKALCPLDWLVPVILRNKCSSDLLKEHQINYQYNNSVLFEEDQPMNVHIVNANQLNSNSQNEFIDNQSENIPIAEIPWDESIYERISKKMQWYYQYEKGVELPEKILISEIKRNYYSQKRIDVDENALYFQNPIYRYPDFITEKRKLNAVEQGTAIHTVMEHLDITAIHNEADAIALLEHLYDNYYLSLQEKEVIPVNKILNFINSPIGLRMKKAKKINKEVPFVLALPPEELYFDQIQNQNTKVMVHGMIDCYFEEDGEIVILDYKTDFVEKNNLHLIQQRYKIQMEIYKKAVEMSLNKKVKELLVYLFHLDTYISIGQAY